MKVPDIEYSNDGMDEKEVEVELDEYLKKYAQIEYTNDWGNGSAIIISIDNYIPDGEKLAKAIKEQLGMT